MRTNETIHEGDLLGVEEASRLIGWRPSSLYRAAWSRKIRSFKVGRSLKFLRQDLLALVQERAPLKYPGTFRVPGSES